MPVADRAHSSIKRSFTKVLETVERPLLVPGLTQNPNPVLVGHFVQGGIIKTCFAQGGDEFGQAGNVYQVVGHGGAVEVGAKADVVDADTVGDIDEVADNFAEEVGSW